jgi:hypothetical protein
MNSQGRQPLEQSAVKLLISPGGEAELGPMVCRPSGAGEGLKPGRFQGLAPLDIHGRPFGAIITPPHDSADHHGRCLRDAIVTGLAGFAKTEAACHGTPS